jgi:hypothetical protein
MTAEDEVNRIVNTLRTSISSAIGEQIDKVAVEIKELTKAGTFISVSATFKVAPFLGGRMGRAFVILAKSESGFEIASLKIDEKAM